MNLDVITTAEQLASLRDDWDKLIARANVTHPFVTHAWMQSWWECFGAGSEMMILVVREEGEVVAIAPLLRRKRIVRFIANAHTPRCDFIVAEGRSDAYRAISDFLLRQSGGWNVLQLRDVPTASPTLGELAEQAARHGYLTGVQRSANSPVLPTTEPWERSMENFPPKRRWYLRNRLKRLSKLGRVSLETISGGDGLPKALEDGFRLEAAAWKGKAGTAIACDPVLLRFYATLAQRAADRGWLRLQFLKVDEKRIAFAYCLAYANRMFLLKPGFDPEYGAHSPGNLLFYLSLQELHGQGFVAYDFLGYDDHWKRQWASEGIGHSTLFLYARRPLARLDHYTRFALLPRLRRARHYVLGSAN